MYPVEVIAKKICELSNWQITNLELQKILYIINMLFLGQKRVPLIKENFEAWMYGPVVPKLYYGTTKIFGADKIENWAFDDCDDLENKEINEFIEKYYNQLKDFKPFELVSLTHIKDGGWDKNYNPNYNSIISNEDIIKEFQNNYVKSN